MMDALQRATFEASEPLGPHWSALAAGFAVYVCGVLHITPAGERYLASIEPEEDE